MKIRRAEDVLAKVNSLANPSMVVGGQQRLTEQAVAEYLRYGLCMLSKAGTDERPEMQPVHIGRLLSRVRKQLGPLLPDQGSRSLEDLVRVAESKAPPADICRQVLDKLDLIREVEDLGRGYYLPTPLRLIDLPSGYALVVGALPTSEAEKALRIKLKTAGLGRFVHTSSLPTLLRTDSSARQSLSNWLGIELGLQNWVESYLRAATKDLGASVSEIGSFEVYLSENSQKKHQYFRWCDGKSWTGRTDRLYLCRSTAKNGPRPYWLGLLARVQDDVRVVKEAELESPRDVPRLLYGLDLLAKAPVTAEIMTQASNSRLTLSNWLPKEEERLIQAIAVDVSEMPDKLPRLFSFENRWRGDIENVIRGLGIEFRSEPTPRS